MKHVIFAAFGLAIVTPAVAAVQEQASAPSLTLQNGDTETVIQSLDDPHDPAIDQAFKLLHANRHTEAVELAEQAIARFEDRYGKDTRPVYSARSMTEAVMYGAMAAAEKKSSLILNGDWADAYFIKGFALIDLKRSEEAKPYFDRAIALAPMNAQLLAERAEWHKSRREWAAAFEGFEAALSAADIAPEDSQAAEKARALRGMGFVRIEQGELKEAEKLFKQSLKLQPNHAGALSELNYIKQLKSR